MTKSSIDINLLDKETLNRLGLKKQRSKSPDKDEVDRFAYKIIGLLSDCSSRSVRTKALKKALSLHK